MSDGRKKNFKSAIKFRIDSIGTVMHDSLYVLLDVLHSRGDKENKELLLNVESEMLCLSKLLKELLCYEEFMIDGDIDPKKILEGDFICKFPKIKKGSVSCLRCGQNFYSYDKAYNRICEKCNWKTGNKDGL